jgi:cytochrome c6
MRRYWLALAFVAGAAPFAAYSADADDAAEGRRLFTKAATPPCAICHTLKHAGANAEIGPSLDELRPDAARVEKAIRSGIGQMPAYTTLGDGDIQSLARYVAKYSGTQ